MRIPLFAVALLCLAVPAMAEEPLHLTIKDHKFQPERIEIPAGTKIKLLVRNDDDVAAEFESFQMDREKVVPPGKEVPVFIGPLDKGEYPFFDDFHQDAKGVLVAR